VAVAAGDVAADYHSRARRPSVPPSPPSDDNDDRGVFHHSVTRLPSTPHVCLVTRAIGRCKRWKLLVDAGGRKSPVHVHRHPREPSSGLHDRMDAEIARRSVQTSEYIETRYVTVACRFGNGRVESIMEFMVLDRDRTASRLWGLDQLREHGICLDRCSADMPG
jgi:hypothetical protein